MEVFALLIGLLLWAPTNLYLVSEQCQWWNNALPAINLVVGICWSTVFCCSVVSLFPGACTLAC